MKYSDLILLEISSDGIRILVGGFSVKGKIDIHYKSYDKFIALDRNGIVSEKLIERKLKACIKQLRNELDISTYQILTLFKDYKTNFMAMESSLALRSEIITADKFDKFIVEINKLKPKISSELHNEFFIDNRFTENPIGSYGEELVNKSYFYTYNNKFYKELSQIINKVELKTESIGSIYALNYKKIFQYNLLKEGLILMDFSYKQTNLLLFKKGLLKTQISIPIGFFHIINDISIILNISNEKSESLVKDYGNALNLRSLGKEITIFNDGADKKIISIDAINEIISARINETLELVAKKMNNHQLFSEFKQGIYITGIGSNLRYIQNLLRIRFGLNVFSYATIVNQHILKKQTSTNEPEFDLLKSYLISYIKSNYTKEGSFIITKTRISRWFQLSLDGLFK